MRLVMKTTPLMVTMMFKKTAADEIAFEMSEAIKNSEPKTETSGNKLLDALAHLNSAAELLDSAGMEESAEAVTNIMVRSASDLQPKETLLSSDVVERLRQSLIAIEQELGISPQGSFASVRERLDKLERGK